uniref:Uncharacterized protein n=1 Tax=Anguilla anguilla TaxID=7936 RepID=A0A0E9SBG8_ANGAN
MKDPILQSDFLSFKMNIYLFCKDKFVSLPYGIRLIRLKV